MYKFYNFLLITRECAMCMHSIIIFSFLVVLKRQPSRSRRLRRAARATFWKRGWTLTFSRFDWSATHLELSRSCRGFFARRRRRRFFHRRRYFRFCSLYTNRDRFSSFHWFPRTRLWIDASPPERFQFPTLATLRFEDVSSDRFRLPRLQISALF